MNARLDWSDDFFTGLWLDYQRAAWSEGETEQDTDAAEELLDLEPGSSILDVPCGDGRIAASLHRRGYRVTGVDRTAAFLDTAHPGPAYERHEMTDLPYDARFDGAVCWWGSIGYRSEEEDDRFFASVARALKPGGVFVLDTHILESVLPNFEERSWERAGDIHLLEERRFDYGTGRIETTWTLMRGNEREVKDSSMRIYSFRELALKLIAAGFEIEFAAGGHHLARFELGDPRLIVRSVKG